MVDNLTTTIYSGITISSLTDDEKLLIKAYREAGDWGRVKEIIKRKGKLARIKVEKEIELDN